MDIGQITFGVAGDTAGLQKISREMDKFRKKVDDVASKQSTAAKATQNAYVKQESALKRAAEATRKLQTAQRAAFSGGGRSDAIRASTLALKTLKTELTSGELSAKNYTRSMDAFNIKLARSTTEVRKLQAAAKKGGVEGMSMMMRNLESASVLAIGPLSGLGARIRSLGAIAGRVDKIFVAMFAGLAAGTVIIWKMAAAALNANRVLGASMARFKAVTGDIAAAKNEMVFVTKVSRDLGLRLDTTAKAYSRLAASAQGTRLEGEGVRKIFLSVSKAAAALRLGQGEVEGAFRAIEQIMSKGTVQAEELRGQLGERLPGAFRIAAESMGKTTRELGNMLKAGELTALDFLPKFAVALEEAFGATATDNLNSLTGATNSVYTEFLLFSDAFDKATGISAIFVKGLQALSGALEGMTKHVDNVKYAVEAFAIASLIYTGPALVKGVLWLAKALRLTAAAQWALNAAMMGNPVGKAVAITVKGVAKLAAFLGILGGSYLYLSREQEEAAKAVEDLTKAMDEQAKADLIGVDLSKGTIKVQKDIKDLIHTFVMYDEALANIRGGQSVEAAFAILTQKIAVSKAGIEDYTSVAGQLSASLGFEVEPNINAVAAAMAIWNERNKRSVDLMDRIKNSGPAITKIMQDVEKMNEKSAAMEGGAAQAELYDKVTSKVNAYRAALTATTLSEEAQAAVLKIIEAAIIRQNAAAAALAQAKKDDADATREQTRADRARAKAIERVNEAMTRSAATTDLLRAKITAIASGPNSFEIYEKVLAPLKAYEESLRRQGVTQETINLLSGEYKFLLEEQMRLQGPLGQAAVSAANSIGNALESMIMKTETLSESLKNLARELLNLFARSMFIDPLVKSLAGSFGSLFTGGSAPGVSAFPGGGLSAPARAGGGPVAGGGIYTVGEDGPEILRMGSQGGSIIPNHALGGATTNITINAPGADQGTVARIKEMIKVEMVPQIIQASSDKTVARFKRPRFA